MSYWRLDFHQESRLGTISLPIRDTLANALEFPAENPWNRLGRSTITLVDWQFLNTRFPVLSDLSIGAEETDCDNPEIPTRRIDHKPHRSDPKV